MAAKPIERYVKKQIADQGGWDRILERIASGETVADVARTMRRPDGQAISRAFFSRLLHADELRSAQVLKIRADQQPDAMVDQSIYLVDNAQPDRDSIAKAKVQADMRLKVAGFLNRERWGDKPQQLNVQVNTGDLYLNALRHREIESVTSRSDTGSSVSLTSGTQDVAVQDARE